MNSKKRILVAPLNWGLGHATRCIPIIHALIVNDFEPIIASDGNPLKLLKKEFPELIALELPPYQISYSKKGKSLKLKLLKDSPTILKAIKKEKKVVNQIIEAYNISGIISDNRFGVRNKSIPSVFITHQLQVLSGNTSWLSSKMHEQLISKFDEYWVPDVEGFPNLSGKLGHIKRLKSNVTYIGPISRFKKKVLDYKYDVTVLLSGPEPQRTLLEGILFEELKKFDGHVLFIKGIVEDTQVSERKDNFTIYNFMQAQELETALNQSRTVLSRSGYTTIMDLAKLEKNAFFIPTPGQYEQEYLAKTLSDMKLVPFCKQEAFSLEKLNEIKDYTGLSNINDETDFKILFSFFKSE